MNYIINFNNIVIIPFIYSYSNLKDNLKEDNENNSIFEDFFIKPPTFQKKFRYNTPDNKIIYIYTFKEIEKSLIHNRIAVGVLYDRFSIKIDPNLKNNYLENKIIKTLFKHERAYYKYFFNNNKNIFHLDDSSNKIKDCSKKISTFSWFKENGYILYVYVIQLSPNLSKNIRNKIETAIKYALLFDELSLFNELYSKNINIEDKINNLLSILPKLEEKYYFEYNLNHFTKIFLSWKTIAIIIYTDDNKYSKNIINYITLFEVFFQYFWFLIYINDRLLSCEISNLNTKYSFEKINLLKKNIFTILDLIYSIFYGELNLEELILLELKRKTSLIDKNISNLLNKLNFLSKNIELKEKKLNYIISVTLSFVTIFQLFTTFSFLYIINKISYFISFLIFLLYIFTTITYIYIFIKYFT